MALLSNASARASRVTREVVGAAARGDARGAQREHGDAREEGAANARGAHVEVTKRGRPDKTNRTNACRANETASERRKDSTRDG